MTTLEELEARVARIENLVGGPLSDISSDMGTLTGGQIRIVGDDGSPRIILSGSDQAIQDEFGIKTNSLELGLDYTKAHLAPLPGGGARIFSGGLVSHEGIPAYSMRFSEDYRASPNLIVNSGFETGDFTGWTTHSSSEVVADERYEGLYSAKIQPGKSLSQSVSLTPSKAYIVSARIKCSGNVKLAVWANERQTVGSGEWERLSFAFVCPMNTTTMLVGITAYTAEAYIDAVEMYEIKDGFSEILLTDTDVIANNARASLSLLNDVARVKSKRHMTTYSNTTQEVPLFDGDFSPLKKAQDEFYGINVCGLFGEAFVLLKNTGLSSVGFSAYLYINSDKYTVYSETVGISTSFSLLRLTILLLRDGGDNSNEMAYDLYSAYYRHHRSIPSSSMTAQNVVLPSDAFTLYLKMSASNAHPTVSIKPLMCNFYVIP